MRNIHWHHLHQQNLQFPSICDVQSRAASTFQNELDAQECSSAVGNANWILQWLEEERISVQGISSAVKYADVPLGLRTIWKK